MWLITIGFVVCSSAVRRARQFRFFGITKSHTSVIAYLSTLRVFQWGSTGPGGKPAAFHGEAIPGYELESVVPLVAIWQYRRLDRLSGPVRDRLGSLWWVLRELRPQITPSPQDSRGLNAGGCVICIGGNAYNAGTAYVFSSHRPTLAIDDGLSVKRRAAREEWRHVPPDDELRGATDFAIVERITSAATDTTYFILAGMTTVGTRGAVHFVSRHWADLARATRSRDFALCLRFDDVLIDPNSHARPTLVFASNGVGLEGWRRPRRLLREVPLSATSGATAIASSP